MSFPIRLLGPTSLGVERYEVACDKTLRRAALMILDGDKIEALPLLPGATIADPSLQVDAANIVTTAALTRGTNECNEAAITDTALTEKPRVGQPRKERWSVSTCGDVQVVDVVFTPSAEGGTNIAVSSRDEVRLARGDHGTEARKPAVDRARFPG